MFKTVDPFLPFTPLSADIEHARVQVSSEPAYGNFILVYLLDAQLSHLESRLVYACRLCSGPQHVHLVREVIRSYDSHDLLEKARDFRFSQGLERHIIGGTVLFGRVHQVELCLPFHQLFPGRIAPYSLHGLANFRVDLCLGPGLHGVV